MKKGKTSLLVGATGFIGRHLANYLLSKNEQVIGTYIHKPQESFDPRIRLIRFDVTHQKGFHAILKKYQPNCIYYLAALSSVCLSWDMPIETFRVNTMGCLYLLETLRNMKLTRCKVLIFSSGTVYGFSHRGKALDENGCLRPKDPYSVSKTTIDHLSRLYASRFGLNLCVVRLGNCTGPGQSTVFSLPNFASQIAKIEHKKSKSVIHVGDLSARRDYLDIRDGLKAIYLVMKKGKRGEVYNIATGRSHILEELFQKMILLSRIDRRHLRVKKRNYLIPQDEIKEMKLNPSKLMKLTRWKPTIPIGKTLGDILDSFRRRYGTLKIVN